MKLPERRIRATKSADVLFPPQEITEDQTLPTLGITPELKRELESIVKIDNRPGFSTTSEKIALASLFPEDAEKIFESLDMDELEKNCLGKSEDQFPPDRVEDIERILQIKPEFIHQLNITRDEINAWFSEIDEWENTSASAWVWKLRRLATLRLIAPEKQFPISAILEHAEAKLLEEEDPSVDLIECAYYIVRLDSSKRDKWKEVVLKHVNWLKEQLKDPDGISLSVVSLLPIFKFFLDDKAIINNTGKIEFPGSHSFQKTPELPPRLLA